LTPLVAAKPPFAAPLISDQGLMYLVGNDRRTLDRLDLDCSDLVRGSLVQCEPDPAHHARNACGQGTNMSVYVAMNGIYAMYFSPPFPARTAIGDAALPLGACVQIDLVVKA
jgi:hypothetical protein